MIWRNKIIMDLAELFKFMVIVTKIAQKESKRD